MEQKIFYARGHSKLIIFICIAGIIVFLLLTLMAYTSIILMLPFVIMLIPVLIRFNMPYVVMDNSSLLVKPAPLREKVLILISDITHIKTQPNTYTIYYKVGNSLNEKNLRIYLNGLNANEKHALSSALDILVKKVNE